MSAPRVSVAVVPAAAIVGGSLAIAGLAIGAAASAAGAAGGAIVRREQLRRHRRRQLQERAQGLSSELREVAAQWQAAGSEHGDAFPEWPYGPTLQELAECEGDADRGEDELRAALDALGERVAEARTEYTQQSAAVRMRASLRAALESQAVESGAASRPAEDEGAQGEDAQGEEHDLRSFAEDVTRLLQTLAAEVRPEDRAAIEEQSEAVIGAPTAFRREALRAQLRLDIQRANEAAAARRRTAARVEEWRERLLGFEAPEVQELDAELRRVAGGDPLPPGMAQRVEDVVARATDAANRDYALGVITEELGNLGYVVESGFETASAPGSEVLLHKPDMEDDYHVSLRADGLHLHNRVVREAADPAAAAGRPRSADRERTDTRMERTWCQDLAAALAAAERRGVLGRAVSREEPGQVPVVAIAPLEGRSRPESTSRRRRKRRRSAEPKSRVAR